MTAHPTNPSCPLTVREYVYGFYYRSHIDLYYEIRRAQREGR